MKTSIGVEFIVGPDGHGVDVRALEHPVDGACTAILVLRMRPP